MKIAQVAPLYESVPPKLYGGTERIVSYLTEELVNEGHDVTLYASGDSVTKAKLRSPWCCALRLQDNCIDQLSHHIVLLELVQKELKDFDIVHYHIDYLHFPLSRRSSKPHITTLHGRLDIPDLVPLYKEYNEIPLVSISNHHRTPLPYVNWAKTIYHGLPEDLLQPKYTEGKYLAFIGRFSPEKRPDRAIEIAIKAGIPIKLAAKVDKADKEYFESVVKPLLDHPLVEYIGEINEKEKSEFLGNAIALLFLIDWPEPFGLVMIEAMACGTPVIAYGHGSVPEVIDDGISGFIVSSQEEALSAVHKAQKISRQNIRAHFVKRFSAGRMAKDYLEIYEQMISLKSASNSEEKFLYNVSQNLQKVI
jgi:glycosyltransferase involved in cell wall biosynthesis